MKKKIFDLTENFTSPEILNKYRHTDKKFVDIIIDFHIIDKNVFYKDLYFKDYLKNDC